MHGTTLAVGRQHPSIFLYRGNIGLSQGYTQAVARGRGIGFCCVVVYHFARDLAGIEYIPDVGWEKRSRGTRATVVSRTKLLFVRSLRLTEWVKAPSACLE